ncbi:hypothetical protein ABW13_16400 [Pluralibacter gergoviae]|nr:hypothetical protein ABW13_16400 [Pluralibacter gergoviae]
MHVVIFIFSKSSAKKDIRFTLSESTVFFIVNHVECIINRIICFRPKRPLERILFSHYRFFRINFIIKMFMLYGSCIRNFKLSIINNRYSLIILFF